MDYFDNPAISNTKLGWYKKSPAHFRHFQDNGTGEQEKSDAFAMGSASHLGFLEPDKFLKNIFVFDENKRPLPDNNFNKSENKAWKKEIMDANAGKQIITVSEYNDIMRMMEVLKKNEVVQDIIKDAVFEQEAYWTCPETGLSLKKKEDIKSSVLRADYKTAENADPFIWQKKAWGFDYYRQAGFYDLHDPKEEFYFIVQEKTAPYAVSVHKCTRDLLNHGKDKSMEILRGIKTCHDMNMWPGYEMKTFLTQNYEYFDFDIPAWVIQNM